MLALAPLFLVFCSFLSSDYSAAYHTALKTHQNIHLIVYKDEQVSDSYKKVLTKIKPEAIILSYDIKDKFLEHPAFKYLDGKTGMIIIDPKTQRVNFAYKFTDGLHLSKEHTAVILNLPDGTLTQRTLMYALRTHLERPQSCWSENKVILNQHASNHCKLLSERGMGHHNWGERQGLISRAVGRMPVEVAGEAWTGDMVGAAREIVSQWRSSGVHWGMVSAPSVYCGYDMVNVGGRWYATGILCY